MAHSIPRMMSSAEIEEVTKKILFSYDTFGKNLYDFKIEWDSYGGMKVKPQAGGGHVVTPDNTPRAQHPAQGLSAKDRVATCKPVTVV